MEHHESTSAKIDDSEYAHVYNLILGSQQNALLMTVYRVWDTGGDVRSFPNFKASFDWDGLRGELTGDDHKKARLKAIDDYSALVDQFTGSDDWLAIKVARSEGIAHNAFRARDRAKMAEPRVAQLGTVYDALDKAVKAYDFANLAVNSSDTGWQFFEEDLTKMNDEYFLTLPDIKLMREERIAAALAEIDAED